MKTVLGAAAVSLTPAWAARACFGQFSAPVREFRLSASRARVRLGAGQAFWAWTINGQVFPEVAPIRVPRGELLRLGYRNHSMMPHPMHLHGHFFRVVHPALPRDRWIQKDTVIVDPMQRVEIEFVADNPGAWFHHCHNLYYMNAGMTNVVTVEA